MNIDDDLQTPSGRFVFGDPRERRREQRLEYSRPARLMITDPPWAMTPKPLHGFTQDITMHGLRLRIDHPDPQLAGIWADAVANDVDLKIEIVVLDATPNPVLKGQIVWTHREETAISVGVLFSVMAQKTQSELQQLVASLNTPSQ
ncbi:PilZ domain-containing protein [Candidatus Sumerlaeota bacterium]|nr:PilZ domain-containing protein [Candidatus Sumerlaeota bacterium]